MLNNFARARVVFAVALLGLTLAGCGYNQIPTWRSRPRPNGPTCRTTTSAAPT